MLHLLWLACASPAPGDSAPQTRAWTREAPPLRGEEVVGWRAARSIVHLHSPWSHDACDGDPLPNGAPNAPCLADFREALCAAGLDAAFVTDHPAHAAAQDYGALLWLEDGDEAVTVGGQPVGNRLACGGPGRPLLLPGVEDTLMPLGLHAHVAGDAAARDATYNSREAAAFAALEPTGALIGLAHTEGEAQAELERLQDLGLQSIEAFNLHAMVDPDIRAEDLGLDAFGWTSAIAPFTDPDSEAEPDLLFLAFFEEQAPSLAAWDALNARGPMLGTAGTDAHQNVLPLELRDGERVDSYRRMMRWFSNWVLLDEGAAVEPEGLSAALAAGRSLIVFEALGVPDGVEARWDDDSGAHGPGADVGPGTLTLRCPGLSPDSPRGELPPEVDARVLRDGVEVARGCGAHTLTDPGVYRVVFTITPHHLLPLLGEATALAERAWPWVYTNPWRLAP